MVPPICTPNWSSGTSRGRSPGWHPSWMPASQGRKRVQSPPNSALPRMRASKSRNSIGPAPGMTAASGSGGISGRNPTGPASAGSASGEGRVMRPASTAPGRRRDAAPGPGCASTEGRNHGEPAPGTGSKATGKSRGTRASPRGTSTGGGRGPEAIGGGGGKSPLHSTAPGPGAAWEAAAAGVRSPHARSTAGTRHPGPPGPRARCRCTVRVEGGSLNAQPATGYG